MAERFTGPIAYLTGEYPRATDTFIQRAEAALRALGLDLRTCSIRRTGTEHLVGPEQRAEAAATFHVLEAARNPLHFLGAHLRTLIKAPARYGRALALRVAPPGLRGLVYHLIYFAEAGVLAGHLRRERVAHIHNHIATAACTVTMLTYEMTGIPYSFTIHGLGIFFESMHWRIDEKVARARFVVCISDFCRSQMMQFAARAHWDKLHVVHCGVDPARYAPGTTAGASKGARLLFVGRLEAIKGVPLLFGALAQLRPVFPDLHLLPIGDGPERPMIEAEARALSLTGLLTFTGYQSQDAVAAALARLPKSGAETFVPVAATRASKPTVMVIGGTGFIGSHLTRALVAAGHDVRVVSRGRHGPFADLPDQVETLSISLKDRAGLAAAMAGVDTVYHLGKALESTWEACLENDVGVTERIAEAALQAGVRRFVYTGTIASYDMSDPARHITEATGFVSDMTDRNLYARSKAACEARLLALWRGRGLPLVIAGPGIVLGKGGPLQHWGIGRWHGAGAVRGWGNGRNTLPFVLIDDVVAGLMLMRDHPGIEGQSFNLVGDPIWTARDYFDSIHAQTGTRIKVRPGVLTLFWAADAVKYLLKRHVLRRHGVLRPSLRDWKSRAHLSPLANDQAKTVLSWAPEADRAAFARRAVVEANLFGL